MEDLTLVVERREATGKNANRRIRALGQVPGVVYGGGRDPVPIQLERIRLRDILKGPEGQNRLFLLKLEGTESSRHAMIKELQVDPITRLIQHVDFQRVLLTETVRVSVPVDLQGEPFGVRTEGGMLDFVTREVEVECLPNQIPNSLPIGVGKLHIGQHVEAGDLDLPEGVVLITETSRVLAACEAARAALIIEEEEGEGLVVAAPEQPEVIGRGKAEDDAES